MQLNLTKKFKYIEFGIEAVALSNKITKKLNILIYNIPIVKVKVCLLCFLFLVLVFFFFFYCFHSTSRLWVDRILVFYFHLITVAVVGVCCCSINWLVLLNNDYWFLWLFDYAMMHRKTCNGLAQRPAKSEAQRESCPFWCWAFCCCWWGCQLVS